MITEIMSRLDLVIFGATGFTGKKAVEEVARGGKYYDGLTWGIAGRSQSKLETLLADISKSIGKDLSHLKIIIAEVSDQKSLVDMCAQAKVLVNCCGPYRMYGEPVVQAAIEAKTHYVDVSGEPQFIEQMQLRYNESAREAGVFIISACGFDSIPNDMGVVFMEQVFDGTLNSVESYLSTHIPPEYRKEAMKSGLINYGTWESLVYSLAHYDELVELRKKMYPERLPTFKPKLERRGVLHRNGGRWCVPFMGADGSIVYRTQRDKYERGDGRPVQFKAYLKLSSLMYTLMLSMAGVILFLMSKTSFTRRLLLNHPRFFSGGMVTRQGPKDIVTTNTHFRFDLVGRGWAKGQDVNTTPPNKKVVVRVSGSNPGYGATVVALLFSALTLLREQGNMPAARGVLTTGMAFRNTNLIKHLNENNLKFEILDEK